MCLIRVPNLKEIHPREGCFFLAQSYCFKSVQRRRNMKKIGQFLETHISKTTWLIFFKFSMPSRVYGGHNICKFGTNRPSIVVPNI